MAHRRVPLGEFMSAKRDDVRVVGPADVVGPNAPSWGGAGFHETRVVNCAPSACKRRSG
jgi:hypothetical protein